VLRPRPSAPVGGRRLAFFCTAPPAEHPRLAAHLRDAYGADVVHVSGNLADRQALRAELPRVDAEVFAVELKAAAVDVVAEDAAARGIEVVLAANDVVALPGQASLDGEIRRLADEVAR
jgi:cyclic 2,3-diphosphoglycerate synthetase